MATGMQTIKCALRHDNHPNCRPYIAAGDVAARGLGWKCDAFGVWFCPCHSRQLMFRQHSEVIELTGSDIVEVL